jgi:hypothetical protein
MIRAVFILVLVGLASVACGRRGELQAPGIQEPEPVVGPEAILSPASPGATAPPERKPEAAPEKRFILDPLI